MRADFTNMTFPSVGLLSATHDVVHCNGLILCVLRTSCTPTAYPRLGSDRLETFSLKFIEGVWKVNGAYRCANTGWGFCTAFLTFPRNGKIKQFNYLHLE